MPVLPMQSRDQNIFSARRGVHSGIYGRLADGSDLAAGQVHGGDLRPSVIVEKILVVRALQEIFKGGDGSGSPKTFLDVRTNRNFRLSGRLGCGAVRGNRLAKEPGASHPFARSTAPSTATTTAAPQNGIYLHA